MCGYFIFVVFVFWVNKVELRGDDNDNGLDFIKLEKKKKW